MLAQAVAACTACVHSASGAVARTSGPLDGQLFAIRQLLTLREQLSPFDVEFAVVEKDLDFTHMRDHLRRMLSGETSSLSSAAPLCLWFV